MNNATGRILVVPKPGFEPELEPEHEQCGRRSGTPPPAMHPSHIYHRSHTGDMSHQGKRPRGTGRALGAEFDPKAWDVASTFDGS